MFEAFEGMKEERKEATYKKKLSEHSGAGMAEMARDAKASKDRGSFWDHETDIKGLSGPAMLAHLIDNALEIETHKNEEGLTQFQIDYMRLSEKCANIEKTVWFTAGITFTIVIVGIMIGVDTDRAMTCERFLLLGHGKKGDSVKCYESIESSSISVIAQIIFTAEAMTKICAQGLRPMKYFDDNWNRLDFFIVLVGFVVSSFEISCNGTSLIPPYRGLCRIFRFFSFGYTHISAL